MSTPPFSQDLSEILFSQSSAEDGKSIPVLESDGSRESSISVVEGKSWDDLVKEFFRKQKEKVVEMIRSDSETNLDSIIACMNSLQVCESLIQKHKEKDGLASLCHLMKSSFTYVNAENVKIRPLVRCCVSPGVYQGKVISCTRKKFRVQIVLEYDYGTEHVWIDNGFRNVIQKRCCSCGKNTRKRKPDATNCESVCSPKTCDCRAFQRECDHNCWCHSHQSIIL